MFEKMQNNSALERAQDNCAKGNQNCQMINSLELLEQINFFRSQIEGKSELAHKTLLEIIRMEFEEEIGEQKILPTSYTDSQNKSQPMFVLTYSQAKQVLVRESKAVRKAVIRRLEELENHQPTLVERWQELDEYEQAILFFQTAKEKKDLQANYQKSQEQVGRLMFVSKTYTTTEIAKELGLKSANQLNQILEERDIQYKVNSTWVLKSQHSEKGYELIKQQELESGRIIYNRHWTQAGRDWILSIFTNQIVTVNF